MNILFKNKSRYPDLNNGYKLYECRSIPKGESVVSRNTYNRIVKMFCKSLASSLIETGMIDLPCDIGSIAVVSIHKKPIYDKRKKCYTYNNLIDWNRTRKEGRVIHGGSLDTVGIKFIAKNKRGRDNFNCFGIRANKSLYKKIKDMYNNNELQFIPVDIEIFER